MSFINEARVKAGKPPLPFLNPLLYPLQGSAYFRDIQAGSNGAYKAGPGYDLVTGLGVPSVKKLIKALARKAGLGASQDPVGYGHLCPSIRGWRA